MKDLGYINENDNPKIELDHEFWWELITGIVEVIALGSGFLYCCFK